MEINYLLLLLFVIVCVTCIIKKLNTMYVMYFILIAVPIGSTNTILDKMDIIAIGGIGLNYIHFIMLFLFIVTIKDVIEIFKLNKKSMVVMLLSLLLIVIAVVIGMVKGNNIISDGQKFVIFLIWACVVRTKIDSNDEIKRFIYITVIAVNVNFLFNIMLNVIRPMTDSLLISNIDMMSEESGFVSYAANISLVTLPFSLYYLLNGKNAKMQNVMYGCNILLSLVNNIVFAGNRTYLILIFGLVLYVVFSSDMMKKQFKNNKWKVLVCIVIGCIALITLVVSNDVVMRKFRGFIETGYDRNIITRINTFKYYIPAIMRTPFGEGLGTPLPLINQFGRFHGSSLFTDNVLINIGMKFGLIGLICFCVFLIYVFSKIMKKKSGILLITYVAFVVAGAIMTGQIFNNYPMTFFFVGISILCINNNIREENSDCT